MMDRKFLAVMLMISMLISGIVFMDLRDYRELNLDYSMDAAALNNTVLVVHQDFHRLYSGLALTEHRPGNATVHLLVQEDRDLVQPRVEVRGDGVLVSWLAVNETAAELGYGHYDTITHLLADVTYVGLGHATALDHDVSGDMLTAAVYDRSGITVFEINATDGAVEITDLDYVPDGGVLAVSGGSVYFPEGGRIMRFNGTLTGMGAASGTVTDLADAGGTVTDLTGAGDLVAWSAETDGEGWGFISVSDGNWTATLPVDREPEDLDMLVLGDMAYLVWDEYSPDTANDDWNDEVKVALIPDVNAPRMEFLDYASYRDGRISWDPELVECDDGTRIYWLDRTDGYGIHWTNLRPGGPEYPVAAYSNGGSSSGMFVLLAMGLTMGPMMAFMFMVTPRNTGSKEARRQKWFRVYVRKEPYLFLKFYFAIVPFLFVGLFFAGTFLGPGTGIGFRMGYENVLKCAISVIAASAALYVLRSERNASMFHEFGYLALGAALFVGLLGFGWYEFNKSAFSPWTLQVVYASGFVSSALTLLGPLLMLVGVTGKKAYAIMLIPLLAILATAFLGIGRFSAVLFLPSLGSVHRTMGIDAMMMELLGMMFVGMVLAMHLFDMLTMERLKPLGQWTRNDVRLLRNRALVISVLIMLALTGMSAALFLSLPGMGLSPEHLTLMVENPTLLMFMPVLVLMLAMMILPNFKEENFTGRFKDSPSKAVYSLYLNLAMLGIIILLVALFVGLLSLLVLPIYLLGVHRADALLDSTCESGLREAAEEEQRPMEDKYVIVARGNFVPIMKKNLKFLLMAPPFMGMIALLAWKSGIRFPFMADVPASYFPLAHIAGVALVAVSFFELGLAGPGIRKAKTVIELLGWSSTKYGVVLSAVTMFFYAATVSNPYVIVIQIGLFQAFVLVYYQRVYPVMLERLNNADREFFKLPEEVIPILMTSVLKVRDDFDLPEPGYGDREGELAGPEGSARGQTRGEIDMVTDMEGECKGTLIGVEPEQTLEARKMNMERQLRSLVGLGAVTMIMGMVMMLFLDISFMGTLGIVVIVLGALLIAIYPYLKKQVARQQPITVYDNGMEIVRNDGTRVFLPFAGFLNCTRQKRRGQDVLILTGSNMIQSIFVWDDISEFAASLPDKVGKDPGKMPAGAMYSQKDLAKMVRYFIPLSLGLGALFAFMMLMIFTDYNMLAVFVYLLPPFSMLMLAYLIFSYRRMARKANYALHVPEHTPVLMTIICVALFLVAATMFPQASLLQPSMHHLDLVKDSVDTIDTYLTLNQSVEGDSMDLNSWVLVDGDVIIRNTTFNFNCRWNGELGMLVSPGAAPVFINCTFSAPSTQNGFRMELHGPTVIENCTVLNVYGDPDRVNGDGGVEVYADSVFRNVTVQGSQSNGIQVGECTLTLVDSRIINTEDDGIEIIRGTLEADNVTLAECYWGLMLQEDAWVNCTRTVLNRCSYALTIADGCHATMQDSSILNSQRRGIRVDPFGTLETENVILEGNARDYYTGRMDLTGGLRIFSVAGIVIGLGAALALLRYGRRPGNQQNRTWDQ